MGPDDFAEIQQCSRQEGVSLNPKLSVVVAAYACADTIVPCLEAVRNSDEKKFELIVVDDASPDETAALARPYADVWLSNKENQGRMKARFRGFQSARAPLIVNIDSDVIIPREMLGAIIRFFELHPEAGGLTARLSKFHPHAGYFSQYKNLYMHYRFRGLPDEVTFFYGSLFALRRENLALFESPAAIADDTAFGQELKRRHKRIFLLREPEIIHLKHYDFPQWLLNDFRIPYDWARIFWAYRGWREIGPRSHGFAHASKAQIVSLAVTPAVILMPLIDRGFFLAALLGALWLALNARFLFFLAREKGILFAFKGAAVTFLDYLVMGLGVLGGFLSCLRRPPGPAGK